MNDLFNAYTSDGILIWCHRISQRGGVKLPVGAQPKVHIWTDEDCEMIDKHYGIDMNARQLADILDVSTAALVNSKYWRLVREGRIDRRKLPQGGVQPRHEEA
jgi:hypothetical protein